MKIIKELYDNKKNVAIIIQPNDDDVHLSNEKLKKKCLNYFVKEFFRKTSSFDKVMNSNYKCDFEMRWVSDNQILCYFNSTNDELFENKIVKTILIMNIDKDQNELTVLHPLYQFRKYKLSYASHLAIEPFITERIDMNDVVWSK